MDKIEGKGKSERSEIRDDKKNSLILALIHQIKLYDKRFQSVEFSVKVFQQLIDEAFKDKLIMDHKDNEVTDRTIETPLQKGREMDLIEKTAILFQTKMNMFNVYKYMLSIYPQNRETKVNRRIEFNIEYAKSDGQLTFSSIMEKNEEECKNAKKPVSNHKKKSTTTNTKYRKDSAYMLNLGDNLRKIYVKKNSQRRLLFSKSINRPAGQGERGNWNIKPENTKL